MNVSSGIRRKNMEAVEDAASTRTGVSHTHCKHPELEAHPGSSEVSCF